MGYLYRKPITINKTSVSGTHTNYVMLVNITSDANLTYGIDENSHIQNSSGYDLTFFDSDGVTELDFERERYVAATGSSISWIKIPSISDSANKTIYMYYGNEDITTKQENITATWSGHSFSCRCDPDYVDATGKSTLTNYGADDTTAGKIDEAFDFDSSTNAAITTNYSGLKTANNFTISCWFYARSMSYAKHILWQGINTANGWGSSSPQEEIHLSIGNYNNSAGTNNLVSFFLGDDQESASDPINITYSTSTTNTWRHAAVRVTGLGSSPSAELYINGVSVGSDTGATSDTGRSTWNRGLYIGNCGTGNRGFYGYIDEIQIAESDLGAGWIKTHYNNVNSPSTFYTIGAEESATPSTGYAHSVNGVAGASIASINGIPVANIAKVNGV
jgi:hypothetical protein